MDHQGQHYNNIIQIFDSEDEEPKPTNNSALKNKVSYLMKEKKDKSKDSHPQIPNLTSITKIQYEDITNFKDIEVLLHTI